MEEYSIPQLSDAGSRRKAPPPLDLSVFGEIWVSKEPQIRAVQYKGPETLKTLFEQPWIIPHVFYTDAEGSLFWAARDIKINIGDMIVFPTTQKYKFTIIPYWAFTECYFAIPEGDKCVNPIKEGERGGHYVYNIKSEYYEAIKKTGDLWGFVKGYGFESDHKTGAEKISFSIGDDSYCIEYKPE